MQQDYYKDLEIGKYASKQEIADAYRRLALNWHPKLCKSDINTAYKNFCRVSEAYEVLSDKEKKTIYDQYGEHKLKEGVKDGGNWKGGYRFSGNPEDIFEKFFGSRNPYEPLFDKASNKEANSVFSSIYPNSQIKPLDNLVVKTKCTLTELYNGCRKKVSYNRNSLNKDARTTSEVTETKELEIRPGMSTQNKLSFKQQGHQMAGVPSSDLIFEIEEVKQKGYKREGNNLIYTVDIDLIDALDSRPFSITTLDNRQIMLSFDEVISPKTVREIEGEGMPIYNENDVIGKPKRGNLLVRFNIRFPEQLTEHQKKELTQILQ